MARFRDNERRAVVDLIYQREGVKVERHRSFAATSLLPDAELWRSWSFRITVGGTRYVRYSERSYVLAPGTIFWNSPVCEPVKAYSLAGTAVDAVVVTVSLQRWRLVNNDQSRFRERNAALLECYPQQPILALQVAPSQLLYVLRRFLVASQQGQTPTAVLENSCRLLLALIGELQFNEHFQRVNHAQRQRVEAAQTRIATSLMQPPSLEAVADELGISPRQLQRDFTALTGLTPVRYRNILRLSEANTMLADTALPIATIAAKLGYANVAHFSAAFRQVYQCSPRDVRESMCSTERTESKADERQSH